MSETTRKRLAKILMWAARVISFIIFGWLFALALLNFLGTVYLGSIDLGIMLLGIALLPLFSLIISWREEWLSSILMLSGTVIWIVLFWDILVDGHIDFATVLYPGSFLTAGILFFSSWLLSKAHTRNENTV